MENKTIINSSGNNSEVQSAANAAHVTMKDFKLSRQDQQ